MQLSSWAFAMHCTNRYWAIATLYEAAIGIGDEAAIVNWENKAKEMKVADWMQETRMNQAEKLKKLIQEIKIYWVKTNKQ
jgi:hypothetical protein